MFNWLKNIDWDELAASAVVLGVLMLATSVSTVHPKIERRIEQQSTNSGKKSEPWFAWITSNGITAGATTIMALFTTTLFFASLGQYRQLRRSVDTMDDTAERQLRAYVFAVPKILNNFQPGKKVEISLDLENVGQTPAYRTRMFGHTEIYPYPLVGNIELVRPAGDPTSSAIVYPKGDFKTSTTGIRSLTVEEMAKLVCDNPVWRLYAVGVIEYDDIFGNPCWTRFCASVKPDGLKVLYEIERDMIRGGRVPEKYTSNNIGYEYSDKHNSADNQPPYGPRS